MTDSWKPTNRLTDDTVLFDAIGKIRESSDKRREIEARVLAENNLASVRQLSEDKKKQFCAIVDAILAEQADVNTQLFADDKNLAEAAAKIKVTPWTKQDNNPEKNSTFMGAPKTNPNKGGYAGGAKAEKTKNGYTAMKRIKEEEEVIDEGLIKTAVRSVAGRAIANDRARKTGIAAYSAQNKAFAPGTSEADRGKHLAASKPRMKAYKKYDALSRGQKAPGSFGTRKEDLEEMYLDIENFVLESEGIDSIDRLNEQGQEKLAAVVEAVMEDILSEEEDEYNESLLDESDRPGGKRSADPRPKGYARTSGSAGKTVHGVKVTFNTSHGDNKAFNKLYQHADPHDGGGVNNSMTWHWTHGNAAAADRREAKIREHFKNSPFKDHKIERYTEKSGALPEDTDLHELSPQLLRRAADKAHQKGNILSRTKGSKDPEARARWGQSMKMSHAAASKEAAATSKSIPSFRNLKDRLGKGEKIRPKFEETMQEGWFSKKTPVEKENAMRRSIKKTDDSVQKHGEAYEKAISRTVRGALGMKQKWTKSGYKND